MLIGVCANNPKPLKDYQATEFKSNYCVLRSWLKMPASLLIRQKSKNFFLEMKIIQCQNLIIYKSKHAGSMLSSVAYYLNDWCFCN